LKARGFLGAGARIVQSSEMVVELADIFTGQWKKNMLFFIPLPRRHSLERFTKQDFTEKTRESPISIQSL
jgi:hypothetical protein